jgi:hypothetical protein
MTESDVTDTDYWFTKIGSNASSENLPCAGFENKNSEGLCMDARGASTEPGTNVIQWYCTGDDNQGFTRVDRGGGWFELHFNHGEDICLDALIDEGNGDDVLLWDCHGDNNQQWSVADTLVGQIRNRQSNKCIDVEAQLTDPDTILHQWTCGSQNSQKWEIWP